MANAARRFDVVIYGASGFTGKLCAEYFAKSYGAQQSVRWAIAGRDSTKLDEVRSSISSRFGLPQGTVSVIVAGTDDAQAMRAMAAQTKVVLSTAGPFDKVGMPVVDACVDSGTHYCDITGEPQFVRKVIDRHHHDTARKKLKIIPCCGFDSVPVDIGCMFMVDRLKDRNLSPTEVTTTLVRVKGGVSGGTLDSAMNIAGSSSREEMREMRNPFYLSSSLPDGSLDQPNSTVRRLCGDKCSSGYDEKLQGWVYPFPMQVIDTRVVHRSNALTNWSYGKDFVYREAAMAPNKFVAQAVTTMMKFAFGFLYFKYRVYHNLFGRPLSRAGQGPTTREREEGHFTFASWGSGLDKEGNVHCIEGRFDAPNGDPGYKQTSAMASEAAVCLAVDDPAPTLHGVLTPSTGLGAPFVVRLRNSPGITFEIVDAIQK